MSDIIRTGYEFLAAHPGTLTLVVCSWYFALLAYARRRMVFAPDEEEFKTQVAKLLADIEAYPERTRRLPEIESARKLIVKTIDDFNQWKPGVLEGWFSSGAHVLGYWDSLHEAKRLMVVALPPDELRVRLRTAEVELRRVKRAEWVEEATALADDIKAVKYAEPARSDGHPRNGAAEAHGLASHSRALLHRALRVLYSVEGAENTETTVWHNKSLWISTSSLLFIVVLAAAFGHPRFLLLGALGGFLSKLVRLRSSKDVPRDYDSYWATFFFSGPLGALTGWAGLMLVHTLNQATLLGPAFNMVSWDVTGTTPKVADAAAFVLGFSATLFDKLIARSEGQALKTAEPRKEPPPGAAEVKVPQPNGGPGTDGQPRKGPRKPKERRAERRA